MSGSTLPSCVTDPLGAVASAFDAAFGSGDAVPEHDGDWGVKATLQDALDQTEVMEAIPEINAVGVDNVRPGQLVRFRCMVQDMYNPEYYVGAYKDKSTGGRWRTTKFTEKIGAGAEPDDSAERKIWERRVLYCVPIPGESSWVRRLDGAVASAPPPTPVKSHEGPTGTSTKRPRSENDQPENSEPSSAIALDAYDDEEVAKDDEDTVAKILAAAGENKAAGTPKSNTESNPNAESNSNTESNPASNPAAKQPRAEDAAAVSGAGAPVSVVSEASESMDESLNLPLGAADTSDGLPRACPAIVKFYENEESAPVKLNDVLELVGVLQIEPEIDVANSDQQQAAIAAAAAAANGGTPATGGAAGLAAAFADFMMDEDRAHNPPTSVVPRFHCMMARQTSARTFAVLPARPDPRPTHADPGPAIEDPAGIQAALIRHLSGPLGGDVLAAEYVLAVVVSRVHTRTDSLALGKLSLTLMGVPEGGDLPRNLAAAIADIAPCVAHLPLSIAGLNARSWTPKKDYGVNRLRSGPLQLAPGTVCVLDETALTSGQLKETGVRNVHALKQLVQLQELEYDFQYHQMRMPADLPSVVTSSAKHGDSVVQGCDCRVPLRMVKDTRAADPLDPVLAKTMRAFVARAWGSDHSIGDEASSEIESAMVAARQGERKATELEFHRWLTIARLCALSSGETELTVKHWKHAMECERKTEERLRLV